MGYTHYWRRPLEFDPARFYGFVRDCRKIAALVKASGIVLEDGLAKGGVPIFDDEEVWFNGSRIDDNHGETFAVRRVYTPDEWERPGEDGRYFDFCKTGRNPYDLAVVACLVALKHWFPDEVRLRSDGCRKDNELNPGIDLAREVIGKCVDRIDEDLFNERVE